MNNLEGGKESSFPSGQKSGFSLLALKSRFLQMFLSCNANPACIGSIHPGPLHPPLELGIKGNQSKHADALAACWAVILSLLPLTQES